MINYNPYEKKNCIIPAIIGAAAGLLGSAVGAAGSHSNMKEQNKFNAEQAQLDREWRESMWNKENEYNTPSAQLARIREAGLSPGLMYQNGGSFAQASVPSGSQARAAESQRQFFDPSIAVQMALQAMQAEQNVKTQKQQEKTGQAQEESIKEQTRGLRIDNDIKDATQGDLINISHMKSRVATIERNITLEKGYQEALKSEEYEKNLQKLDIDLKFYEENWELNIKQAKQAIQDAHNVAVATVKEMESKTALNFAGATAQRMLAAAAEFDLQFKKDTRKFEYQKKAQELYNLGRQGYLLFEQGKTELAKQWLMDSQSYFTKVLTETENIKQEALMQKMYMDLLKGSTQVLSGGSQYNESITPEVPEPERPKVGFR